VKSKKIGITPASASRDRLNSSFVYDWTSLGFRPTHTVCFFSSITGIIVLYSSLKVVYIFGIFLEDTMATDVAMRDPEQVHMESTDDAVEVRDTRRLQVMLVFPFSISRYILTCHTHTIDSLTTLSFRLPFRIRHWISFKNMALRLMISKNSTRLDITQLNR
jgi:hypothetical protein